ncbi:rRNA methyltransferase 2-like protein [Dinothrombium tinctorium]|uniref:rRNA methyltransferase 2, mitochondrial n=1 Tax=Dinothrombium tinctorium TaxID=1965070 RepID=A0A443R915_9ACAR|nr:rRNA methyltransferase 2-like protein [Dinothrombium tinctorium]RWS11832.1 rRNA methyltransferase 2-like protein [Dinothrombium tinctorium]
MPNSLKGRSTSSQQWLIRQLNDPYVKKARYRNYRARSAFKLIEIDEKYRLLRPGMVVLDCGAAPGAFTQVIVEKLQLNEEKSPNANSFVLAVDKDAIHPIPGAHVLPNTDFTKPISQAKIFDILNSRKIDFICSDMAPNATGVKSHDHELIIGLSFCALTFAVMNLQPKTGAFLTKIWDGSRTPELVSQMEKFFESVKSVKPLSSRSDSAESFILGRNFKGIEKLHK